MDAPVQAFDQDRRLRLLNPTAERVLVLDAKQDLGRRADVLYLAHLLDEPDEGVLTLGVPEDGFRNSPERNVGRSPGRWMVRRSIFRQRGVPHTLLLLSDVSTALR
jgi:hypothetical protein